MYCGSRKYYIPPQGRSIEIPRLRGGGGGLKAKVITGKFEAELDFQGVGGGAVGDVVA